MYSILKQQRHVLKQVLLKVAVSCLGKIMDIHSAGYLVVTVTAIVTAFTLTTAVQTSTRLAVLITVSGLLQCNLTNYRRQ